MRVTSSGLFTVLLLMAPLAAVPLFAVFGIPELPMLVASSAYDWTERAMGRSASHQSEDGSRVRFAQPRSTGVQDARWNRGPKIRPDAPDGRVPGRESFASDSKGGQRLPKPEDFSNDRPNWAPMPEALGDWTLNAASHHPPISSSPQNRGRNLAPLAAANGGLTGMQPVSAVVAVESEAGRASRASVQQPVTWHAAVRRLNELGIRQFRLEPGGQDSGFLFVCSFTAADNPRVTHRFEAEADEPLRAVEQVLQQIDAWQNR